MRLLQPALNRCATALLIATAITVSQSLFANVPSWRTHHNGIYDATHSPVDWEEKMRFEIPLESKSNGSPILVNDRIIFTAEPAYLICADSKSGDILWKRSNDLLELNNISDEKRDALKAHNARIAEVGREYQRLRNDIRRLERTLNNQPDNKTTQESLRVKREALSANETETEALRSHPEFEKFVTPPAHNTNGYSSYTPYFDGTHIYAVFGLGVVVAYDLEGNRIWSKFLEHPDHRWGGATMPQIVDGKLIVRFSNYIALDPSDGDVLWKTPSEIVFGTPTPFRVEDEAFLFTPRGEVIRVNDGKMLHEGLVYVHPTRGWSIFNTPTLVDDTLYAVSGVENQNGDAYAYRVPKSLDTLLEQGLSLVWHTQVDKDRYYASPLVHDGIMYIVSRESHITALDTNTGKTIYTHEVKGAKGTAYPSMVLAGDKIYLGIDDGNIVIFKPGRNYQQIARHNVGPYRSTPIFSDTIAYLRTYESLQAVDSL